jgi:hypothetical protein
MKITANDIHRIEVRLGEQEFQLSKLICKCGHGLKHHSKSVTWGNWSCGFIIREDQKPFSLFSKGMFCGCNKFRIG